MEAVYQKTDINPSIKSNSFLGIPGIPGIPLFPVIPHLFPQVFPCIPKAFPSKGNIEYTPTPATVYKVALDWARFHGLVESISGLKD